MNNEIFVFLNFKERKSGAHKKIMLRIDKLDKKYPWLKPYLDLHEYKLVEKKLARKEDYDNWRIENRQLINQD